MCTHSKETVDIFARVCGCLCDRPGLNSYHAIMLREFRAYKRLKETYYMPVLVSQLTSFILNISDKYKIIRHICMVKLIKCDDDIVNAHYSKCKKLISFETIEYGLISVRCDLFKSKKN